MQQEKTSDVQGNYCGVANTDVCTSASVSWMVSAQQLMRPEPTYLNTYSTIQQAMEMFFKHRMSSLLVASKNPLDNSLTLLGRVCLKDVFGQIFLCLLQKDLINLNQVMHKSIESIVLRSQPTLDVKSDVHTVLSVMLTGFPYVTGVVNEGKLAGQICCTDLLKVFRPVDCKDSPAMQFIEHISTESSRISGAMAQHILCLSPRDEIAKAMGILVATDTPGIPVLDEQGNLRRIVSRMDILKYIMQLLDSPELSVFEQKGLILDRTLGALEDKEFGVVSADDPVVRAVRLMLDKNIYCLAVSDLQRSFCGLLSWADILRWFYSCLKKQC